MKSYAIRYSNPLALVTLAVTAALSLPSTDSVAQEQEGRGRGRRGAAAPTPAQETQPTRQSAAFEEQLKRTRPGPEHEKLAVYTGAWDVEIKLGGGAAATTYQGTANNRMLVGGRFLLSEFQTKGNTGNMEGVFVVGFDSRHKRYTVVSFDNFGTYFVTSQGTADEATGKIKMLGTDDDPMMKAMGFTKEFAHVLDLRTPDQYAVEVWMIDTRTPARKEMKYVEYVFQRKK